MRFENYLSFDRQKKEETTSIAWYLTTHIAFYVFLIFFLIFFAWYTYFMVTHRCYLVYGASMKPTLNEQVADGDNDGYMDAVYINLYGKIDVSDVVVLDEVSSENESIIKRVVAKAGDYVTIANLSDEGEEGLSLYRIPKEEMVNGESRISDEEAKVVETKEVAGYDVLWTHCSLDIENDILYENRFYEKFLSDRQNGGFESANSEEYDYYTSPNGLVYVRVPEGKYFCLGDNRGWSDDSRKYGFIGEEKVVGDVEFIVYNCSFVSRLFEVVKYYYAQVEVFFKR